MQVKELRIYQIAVRLRDEVYSEVKKIPKYWLIDDVRQIKRSSSSVPSNITEGYARRFYVKELVKYIDIAIGSSDETSNHTKALYRDGHLTKEKMKYFEKEYKDLSIRIVNYRNFKRKKFNL